MNRLVIFDMDGTLAETFSLIRASYEYAMGEFITAKPPDEEIDSISGYNLSKLLAHHVPAYYLETAVDRYHEYFDENFGGTVRIYPEIKEMLNQLRSSGFRLCVCTSADRQWADITLKQSGIAGLFAVVVTSNDVAHKKPDPAGVEMIMKTVDSRSEVTVFVGDEPNDIKASKEARAKSAAALWGSRKRKEMMALKPDFLLNKPFDLLSVLENAK